ncbi:MAG: PAS domain S-box protein [Pseudomonadota bacterium]
MTTVVRHGAARSFLGLLIALQVLLAVAVVAIGWNGARQSRQKALEAHLQQAAIHVRGIEEHLTQSLHLASLTLGNLTELGRLDNLPTTVERNAALERIQRQMPALRSLSLTDRDGRIVVSSVPANIGTRIDFTPFLPPAPPQRKGLPRMGVPWEGRDFHDGRPSTPEHPVGEHANYFFPLVIALPDARGRFALAAINADYFLNRIVGVTDPDLGHIEVVDYDGRLLLTTLSSQAVGGSLDDPPLLARMRAGEIGASLGDRAHGVEVLTAFRASRNYPFFVLSHAWQKAALAQWQAETAALLSRIGFALAATLLITGLLTLRLRRAFAAEARLQEAQRLAAGVFEHSNDGIVITDADARILAVNPAFERITGYTAADAVGQTPRLLASGRHSAAFYAGMWRALTEHGQWQGEITNRRKDGTLLTEWLTISRVLDDRGGVARYVGVFKDVSVLRDSEQTIRQLSMAVEQSPSSIVITTLEPVIEYVNPHFTKVTGYAPEEAIGQNPRLLQSRLTPPETYETMWARLTAGENWEGEFINRRKDGTVYYERATVAPIRDAAGEIVRYLAIKHDITQQKALEQALVEAKNAAEASSRAKSEFLANMSHEIRTPMNGIIGMTQLALESGLDAEQAGLVRKAHGAAVSLLGILNDILDFSKIEAGKLEFERIPFNLRTVIDHLQDLFATAARKKHLHLLLQCAPEVPVDLVGDPLRLGQVLTNLIGNAIKFTRRGGVELRIGLVAMLPDTQETALRFEVLDSGIGIAPEHMDRLFQAFRQGDGSITREYGGTGLGLAISQRLVAMMGGRIEVSSTRGAGSRFAFTARFGLSPMPVPAQSRALRDNNHSLTGLSALVVEDNPLNQQLAATVLERAGMRVAIAENGAEALARLAAEDAVFDIVLMDIQMPVMDGLAATRRIRADRRHAGLPIIATTAHAMADDRAACLAAGMQDYLTKPLDVAQLYAKIAQWTGKSGTELPLDEASPEQPAGIITCTPRAGLEDIEAAIGRMGGQEDIYREVVSTFLADQAGTALKLKAALAAGDIQGSHLVAHTLKGTAATIGAPELSEAARALDHDIKSGALPPDWPEKVAAIETQLAVTLTAIRGLLDSSPGH